MKKKIFSLLVIVVFTITMSGCFNSDKNGSSSTVQKLVIGASPSPHSEILEYIKPTLKEKNIELDIRIFTDYVLQNNALLNKEIDANFFQHMPYLNEFNEKNKSSIVSVTKTHFEPLGIYSSKYKDLEELTSGAKVGIPNDVTNEARALNLLSDIELITLKEGVGLLATVKDIVSNPKNLEFVELEAAQIPQSLQDLDLAVINGNYAIASKLAGNSIVSEGKQSHAAAEYSNIIAVLPENKELEKIKTLVEVITSEDVKNFINEKYQGYVVPVF